VRVAVLVSPKASRDRIVGGVVEANGRRLLKIAVRAAPEGGKANDAVIELLAKAVRLPRRDLEVRTGAASRRKTVLVSGDPALLLKRLDTLLAGDA
jgi:uncharacterized protein (TIGR00251 family)